MPIASSSNGAHAKAAISALGKIGGPKAVGALETLEVGDSLAAGRWDALLAAAESLEDKNRASALCEAIYNESQSGPHRVAALRTILRVQPGDALPYLMTQIKVDSGAKDQLECRISLTKIQKIRQNSLITSSLCKRCTQNGTMFFWKTLTDHRNPTMSKQPST